MSRDVEMNLTNGPCIWDDCDQDAIYCAGHAKEYMQPAHDELVAALESIAGLNKRNIINAIAIARATLAKVTQ